jgi:cysteinyl-tRNA synthetase
MSKSLKNFITVEVCLLFPPKQYTLKIVIDTSSRKH